MQDDNLSRARFFGKICGTTADYYVVEVPNEGEAPEAAEDMPAD